jgi:hypothetical protein
MPKVTGKKFKTFESQEQINDFLPKYFHDSIFNDYDGDNLYDIETLSDMVDSMKVANILMVSQFTSLSEKDIVTLKLAIYNGATVMIATSSLEGLHYYEDAVAEEVVDVSDTISSDAEYYD